jgi:cobalt-zinc-cadmium efflux system outer membrane protein
MIIKVLKYTLTALMLSGALYVRSGDLPESYLVEAARNNPGLKSKFSEYMAALEKVTRAGALPDPQVTFGYFIQPVETRVGPQRARISASQMFPWFGTTGAKKDAASEMAKSKYEAFEEAKSRLFYDVKSAYYNLYFIQKAIDITTGNIDILTTLHKLALIRVESGLASSVDVLRLEIEIADMENQLALLRDNYFVQQTAFNNLLNVDRQRGVNIPDSLTGAVFKMTGEAVLDSIGSSNHQVLQIEFMEAAYEKQEIAARKAGKPNLMLGLDYMVVGKSDNPMADPSESGKNAFVFPMIGISIPLYRYKYTSMVKEAVLMQESAEFSRIDKINILETTFEKAVKDYNDAERRLPLYKDQSSKANRVLGILQTEYETSAKNFEEVLQIERQLLKYKLELEKARADKNASIAFINYLMGK